MSARGASKLTFAPLTAERWDDFERLFGANGACGGCWCMLNRVPRARYERDKGARNRRAMRALVAAGREPGLLAYRAGEPVGWCSLEPRERFPGLARSRVAQPPDELPAWCVTCLFVRREARGSGVSVALLEAAVAHARSRGALAVDGFPVEPKDPAMPPAFAWTGIASAFVAAGFREVARRAPTRPYMRCVGERKRTSRGGSKPAGPPAGGSGPGARGLRSGGVSARPSRRARPPSSPDTDP